MGFGDQWESCMHTMGMPTPSGLYSDAASVLAMAKALQVAIMTTGDATIEYLLAEGALAPAVGEGLAVAGGIMASWYVGNAIGCCITAGIDLLAINDAGVDTSGVDVAAFQPQGQGEALASADSDASVSGYRSEYADQSGSEATGAYPEGGREESSYS